VLARGAAILGTVTVAPSRVASLRRRLLAWYDASHRALPWRFPQHGADPYRVWLAEVMLQQTQVRAAIPYYERFVARYPTLEALAAADDDAVFALWSGLGYYARCRNLLAAARAALARHDGLPASVELLRALPGFGPYTAGAVASIAFAIPAPAVDGNVARVLSRLFLVEGESASPRVRDRLWAIAGALVPAERPGDFTQALMELGATVCPKAAPACARCPVATLCGARAAGRQHALPAPRRRPARSQRTIACAVVLRGRDVFLTRRPEGGLFGGLWAPPAVELEGAGDALPALRAAVRELGGKGRVGRELAAVTRTLTHRELTLRAFTCTDVPASAGKFVSLAKVREAGVPTAVAALLTAVVDRLEEAGWKSTPPIVNRA
jgi:A/G-specific adenine glycosylase